MLVGIAVAFSVLGRIRRNALQGPHPHHGLSCRPFKFWSFMGTLIVVLIIDQTMLQDAIQKSRPM